jgi:hypothetical protein
MKNSPRIYTRLFCALVIAISLSACKNRLYMKSDPLIEIADQDEIHDANYMARYLMDRDDRLKLQHLARQTEPQQAKKSGNLSTGAGIVGTSLLGNNPLSRSGVNTASNIGLGIHAASFAASMLKSDGNLTTVSKIYLPSQYHGVTINSPEKASRTALHYSKKRINLFAKDLGRTVECIYGCKHVTGAGTTIYKLTRKGFTGDEPYDGDTRDYLEMEQYDPPALFVSLNTAGMKRASFDPIRNRILGFTPAWESLTQNGWQLQIGGTRLTEDGELEFVDDKVFGKRLRTMYLEAHSPIARHFYRTTTGGDNLLYFGYDRWTSPFFALKGDYYKFTSKTVNYFIEYQVDPKTDVTALKWIKDEGQKP